MNVASTIDDVGRELYIQDFVLVKQATPRHQDVDFHDNLGTLSVTEYNEPLGKCVEWRQCELTVESEDQEWAVVQDSTTYRKRTKSGCYGGLRPPVIQLKLTDLKSFRVSRNNHQITLLQNDGLTSSCFVFQNKNAEHFVIFLKSVLQTSECRKDPKLHLVMDQPDVQNLNKSFAELELFTENKTDVIWGFMRKLHNRPLETTMSAFSKVTDVLLYKPHDENEIAEWLSNSLQGEDVPPRNGEEYEVVTRRLALPPRSLPPRTFPLSIDQWANFFNQDGAIPESDIVKEMISHGGVSPCIRKDVWKFLLDYYPWESTYAERETLRKTKVEDYYRMKLQWKSISKEQEDRFSDFKERKSLIEKDVTRTDRTMAFYAEDNNPNLEQLQDILMTYVMYNFDLGYVQGMSDLLSPLLFLIQDEVDSFWCFTSLISRMVRNFDVDQAGMKEQLQQLHQLLSTVEPELANYLVKQDSSNMFFCFRWLLVWFKREFSFDDIYVLWEALWAETRCPNYHLLVCVAILDTEKEALMSNEYGFTEILKHINELSNNIDLNLTLRKADGIYLQLSTAADIPNATRSILGLSLVPEPEQPAEETDSDDGSPNASSGTVRGVTASLVNGAIAYAVDSDEIAFDNSMQMQFL